MKSIKNELIEYLDSNLPIFLESWKKKVVISDNDTYKDEVVSNGLQMFDLVKSTIAFPVDLENIKKLAYKVAAERVAANINIGEFVYNVNLGRSEIIQYIYSSKIAIEELEPVFENINLVFDQFSYYAVTRYTELKDQELQEKITFIDQTHQERLTILGQMASTFVHEFRNPLTAVLGFVKLIRHDHPNLKYLDIITHELNQLNYRISQFLHVSKKELVDASKVEFSLNDMFTEITEFLYASILDGEVEIIRDIEQNVSIYAYKDEIRQVLLNILLNSIDALKNKEKERHVFISVKKNGEFVTINIANNGPQIPKATINTIFEPFFTTKEFGTGIGLFVCKTIIEKHKGKINCSSSKSLTTFSIEIPLR